MLKLRKLDEFSKEKSIQKLPMKACGSSTSTLGSSLFEFIEVDGSSTEFSGEGSENVRFVPILKVLTQQSRDKTITAKNWNLDERAESSVLQLGPSLRPTKATAANRPLFWTSQIPKA